MGAHPVDGRSHYQSEAPALGSEGGSVAANGKLAKSELRLRFKFQKAGEQNEVAAREAVSSDRSLRRTSDGDMRAPQLSNGELADDRDKHAESRNVADDTVVEDPGSPESKNGGDNVAEGPPTCAECGKTFASLKALFGHLRCHPLRGYRGARRPPEAKEKKLQIGAGSSSDKVATAKRGPEAEAATILLELSRDNNLRPTPSPRRESDRLQYRKRKRILDAWRKEMDEEDIGGKGLQLMDAMRSQNADGIEEECTAVQASSSQSVFEGKVEQKKKKKKKKKIKDLESVHESSPPTKDGGYHCSSCNKSFSTHQALGGHIASHNKNKNNSEEGDEAEDGNLAHAEELVDSNNSVPRAAATEHRCTLCPAVFPTGQALGGHKRKHWNGLATTSAPSPPAPSPAPLSESVKKANNVLLGIDLNEMPMLEAEEP